jgi:hypothetical protein
MSRIKFGFPILISLLNNKENGWTLIKLFIYFIQFNFVSIVLNGSSSGNNL